jgi:hypothetical protein
MFFNSYIIKEPGPKQYFIFPLTCCSYNINEDFDILRMFPNFVKLQSYFLQWYITFQML